ncbi:DUF4179 domain-containing protein [Paenibacillus xylanilyticus]|uniref:DUF4179 domain-containing protein n=1 Tax=Paenibacillus xylanilyticus TaxID=248903 RepID=A0A7Y6C5Y8_9BACL|nr:DUF4179 domain-containing protein [Paenibacillus xylanilyticus]NUU80149.1 DUF4179 domain-containing protein [Paenibacillus xylanilyticus]
MNTVESKVKNHMKNHSEHVEYPDFGKMFNSIQMDELRVVDEIKHNSQRGKTKVAIVLGVSVAVMATPVYAAFQYDWSDILSHKSGIESALQAGYGQSIEQSVTAHGVTLTVHNAFVDDNRTVLLYTVRPGMETDGKEIRYDQMVLKDSNGEPIEGHYSQKWNEEQGVYQGYFETDWVMPKNHQSGLQFSITGVRYLQDIQEDITLDPQDTNTQKFNIQKDGIEAVEVQSFQHTEDQIMIRSNVTFTDKELQEQTWARITAYDQNGNIIKETESPVYGTAGATGAYSSMQIFNGQQFKEKANRFTFTYTHEKERIDGTWNLDLSLSQQQMRTGTVKKEMDIPLNSMGGEASIRGIVVTPTQIRVTINHQEDYFRIPYRTYQLEVDGKTMEGYVSLEGTVNPNQTELRFEQTDSLLMDVGSLSNKPMTLIAKDRVDEHSGSQASIRLTDISTQPQTIASDYEGFRLSWTYYLKDGNLYVESFSPDTTFGGINQSYFLEQGDKHYLAPLYFNDSDNKHTEVYKDFKGENIDLYVWNYTTKKPDEELRIPLTSNK